MTHKEIEQYIGLVEEKDTHVVVGALYRIVIFSNT